MYYYISDRAYRNNIVTNQNGIGHTRPYNEIILLFTYQKYTYVIITPTRETNIYDITNIGKVELNDPEHGEPWFDHKVCIILDEGFVPPPLGTIHQDVFDISGLVQELWCQCRAV
jgi:hypothetical protein